MAEGDPSGIVRVSSRLEGEVVLAPHELDERDERVELLTGHFMEISHGVHSGETAEYVRSGGSLRLCLGEIMALSEPSELDQQVSDIRAAYMDSVLRKKGFLGRRERKRELRETEAVYIETVAAKIAAVIDARTPQEALELGQMPTLVEQASFTEGQELGREGLAANHLYILVDTALKEHVQRRAAIDEHLRGAPVTRILGNRMVNMSVAGAVFAAVITPKVGVVPHHNEHTVETIETGLRVLSGTLLALTAPEAARLRYLQLSHDRRSEELHDQLAGDQHLADLALRITYSSTRYGNMDGVGKVTGRSGTDDKEENLRRFAQLDQEFPHLNNDPGGKPYTGEQALGYAARLLIERDDQLRKIASDDRAPAERRELFLDLVKDILTEDLIRMKKGLNVSRLRRRIINTLAVVPAALFPRATSTVHEASELSKGTRGALSSGRKV